MIVSKWNLDMLVAMAMIVGIYVHDGIIDSRPAEEYCTFLLNELELWNQQHALQMPPEYIETRLIKEFGI